MWIHTECSFISDSEYETLVISNYSWVCSECKVFNFSGSDSEPMTQDSRNRFEHLLRKKGNKSSIPDTTMLYFVNGLKFCNANINGFKGNILELLAFLDAQQPHFVAIQTPKIDSTITTSELFPETCMYSVYRKIERLMVVGWCFSFTETSHTCQSWTRKITWSQIV